MRERIYRIVNNRDFVTMVPPFCAHTGELHYITSDERFLTNPGTAEMVLDQLKDDETYEWTDVVPERLTDHAPVNYVAWMQRFARVGAS